jgi:DNA polymerase phi
VHFRVMRFLLVHAFFDFVPGGDFTQAKVEEICLGAPSPALALDVRQLCATRLFGLLADVLAAAQATIRTGGQAEPAAAEAAAAEATARKQRAVECAANLEPLLEVCAKAERAHAHVILAQPMQAEAAAVRKAVRALLPSLDRLAAADGAAARSDACVQAESARALLRVLLLLQLSAPQDYTPDMEDLPRCLQAASGLPATADEAAEVGVEPPHHMDVLVEVLLSLLAKPSAVLRDVVERVFRAFAVSITPEGVRSMLRVVTRSKGRRHSSAKDGSDDSDDDDSDDEESDEDEEEVEEDGDNDEDEDEDEAEEDSEPRKTQPQKAARDAAIDDGEDSDDGAGMEDDAMFKADAALAAVLSLSKAEKSKKKAAAEALTHFKFRVLSLLEMFIKAQPASPLLPVRALMPAAARPSVVCACQRSVL